MMMRRPLSALACTVFLALPAAAQSVKLKAHEIETLLSGNTVVGKWNDLPYRQYFGLDGSTIYAQEGTRSALGQWRVDKEKDEYQSIWPREIGWEAWFAIEYAGAYYWASKSTLPTPFRLEEGQQLIAAGPALEEQFCAALDQFMALLGKKGEEQKAIALPVATPPDASCSTSLAPSGKTSRHCHWLFEYRSDQANEAFLATIEAVSDCLDTQEAGQTEPNVNHPDSYDLRTFETEGGTLSLSLKDKGALQKTAIFLRMEHTTD